MEKMKELYQKIAANEVLKNKFSSIIENSEKAGGAETEKKLLAFAKEAGYDISIKEAQEYFKSLSDLKAGELTSTELDMVAGGKDGGDIANSIFSMGIRC